MGHCTVFVCPSLRGPTDSSDSTPSHPVRPSLLKWVISLLVCCWGSRPSRNSFSGDNESSDNIEMGPMTLREYIATLQPYDPEIHGWRGDEPWTLRRQRSQSQCCTPSPAPCYANGVPAGDSPAYSSVSYHPRKRGSLQLQRNHVI